MYSKIILGSTIFSLILFFSSYNSVLTFTNSKKATLEKSTTHLNQSLVSATDTCIIEENRNGTVLHRINSYCASSFINAYDSHIDNVNLNLTSSDPNLVRGFSIDPLELKEVLNMLESNSGSTLFAMMGIKDDGTTDLVFTIQTEVTTPTETTTYKYEYYDFTMPCPNYCPNKYN